MTNSRLERQSEPVPQLSDQYHRARKQFALFSGLLLGWVLVGVEIPAEQPILANLNIRLLTPSAFPSILVILVIYFAYRTALEWFQLDSRRRNVLPSRIDLIGSFALGAVSIGIYVLQRAIEMRLGEIVVRHTVDIVYITAGTGIGTVVGVCLRSIYVARNYYNYSYKYILLSKDNRDRSSPILRVLVALLPAFLFPVFELLIGEPVTILLPFGILVGAVVTFIWMSFSKEAASRFEDRWKKAGKMESL